MSGQAFRRLAQDLEDMAIVLQDPDMHATLTAACAALRFRSEAEDGYRVALDDALPALEWMMARSQLLSSMNQPTMGHDPRQDELINMDLRLRREFRPLKLLPILETARAALSATEAAQ